jgi:hypothetical protein
VALGVSHHFKILEKINDSAYKIELPSEFGVSPTFNISDLQPYMVDEDEVPLRTMSIQKGEDDEDITMLDTTTPSIEVHVPIMRTRAQRLNHQVNSLLCSSASDLENKLLPNDLIVIKNQGLDHGGLVGHQEGAGEPRKYAQQGGDPIRFGITEYDFKSNSKSRTILSSN